MSGASVGLQDLSSIDIVTGPVPGDDADLVLFITDDGTVTDESEHDSLFLRKLQAYASYVVSAQFGVNHPGIDPSRVLIRVIHKGRPTRMMRDVKGVRAGGIVLVVEVHEFDQWPPRPDVV